MTVLAIDTTTEICSVAVTRAESVIAECSLNIHRAHSERLIPMINSLFENMDLSLRDINLLAISIGPGSFTGLRIGLSTAKGLCFAMGIPLVSVITLDALAFQASGFNGIVCPLIQARKHEFYTAFYEKRNDTDTVKRISEYQVITLENIRQKIPEGSFLLGNGVINDRKNLEETLGSTVTLAPDYAAIHRASSCAVLGYRKYENLKQDELRTVEPFYLQDFKITQPGQPAKVA